MFKIKSLRFFNKLSKNNDWSNYLPIAFIHSKSHNKPVKMIMLNKHYHPNEDIYNKVKVTEKACPKCKKQFSNKYNAERHANRYCIYNKVKKLENKKEMEGNKIILENDDWIIKSQYPNPELRDICYVAGPQGAGKSTYVKNYMESFMDLFNIDNTTEVEYDNYSESSGESLIQDILNNPENYQELLRELFDSDMSTSEEDNETTKMKNNGKLTKSINLISRIENDDSFQKYIEDGTMIPIDIGNEDIIDNPIDSKKELNNSLSIFDDYELLDKKIQKSIEITLKDVLLNGRDQSKQNQDIYCVVTGHQISDRTRTRDILNECGSITVFPQGGGIHAITYALKIYGGLSQQQIDKVLSLPSHYVTIYKRYPNWILWEKGISSSNAILD